MGGGVMQWGGEAVCVMEARQTNQGNPTAARAPSPDGCHGRAVRVYVGGSVGGKVRLASWSKQGVCCSAASVE